MGRQALRGISQQDKEMNIATLIDQVELEVERMALERKARIALSGKDNLCAVKCEQYALDVFGLHKPLMELTSIAWHRGWLNDYGIALDAVGNLSRHFGYPVQTHNGRIGDLAASLDAGKQVLAIVDGGELVGDAFVEGMKDFLYGEQANHCVVVLICNPEDDRVVLYDPAFGDIPLTVTVPQFLNAWADSGNRYIEISKKPIN